MCSLFLRDEQKKRSLAILFTSHKMGEVAQLCDRVIFLHEGKIIADDRPENLARQAPRHRLCMIIGEGLDKAIALAEQLPAPFTVTPPRIEITLDESQIPFFLAALVQNQIFYTNIKILEPNLEDYFLKIAREQ